MTTLDPSTSDLSGLRAQLIERLSRFRQRVRAHLAIEGLAQFLGEVLVSILLSYLIDRWLRLSVEMRMTFLVLALLGMAYEAWRLVLAPVRLDLGLVGMAAALDRASGSATEAALSAAMNRENAHLAGHVATVLELPELLRSARPPSESMVRRAVLRSHESLEGFEFNNRLNRRRYQLSLAALAAVVLVPAVVAIASPRTAGIWVRRWLMGSDIPWPQKTYLQVAGLEDGKLVVPRGEPYVLRVSAREGSASPETVSLRLRQGREDMGRAQLTRFGPDDFRYDGPPLQAPVSAELAGGDDLFGPFIIEPIDRPRIVELRLSSQHPTQTSPEFRSFAGQDSELSFLPRTRLELTVTANVPVAEAGLKAKGVGGSGLRRLSDRQFALAWTHDKPVQLEIEMRALQANLTSLPTPIDIGLKADLPPRVSLQFSGVRQRVTPQAKIPLSAQARDDYGVVQLLLALKSELTDQALAERPTTQSATGPAATSPAATAPAKLEPIVLYGPVQPPTEQEMQPQHLLDVSQFALVPGSLLSVTAQATDACYTGVQTGSSRTVTFRIVAPEELFREILLRQQAERAKFRKAIEDAQKIRELISTIVSADGAVQAARQQGLLQREAWRIRTVLDESMTEIRLNALGSPEATELMIKSVLSPLKALHEGLMAEQKRALEGLAPEDAKAIAAAGSRQEQIVSTMREILKQMSQWDSFVDVLNQLNQIIKVQEEAERNTEQLRAKETESIFEGK